MARLLCPYCGGETRAAPRLWGLPYCERCGWKIEKAEKGSRQMVFIMPIIAFLGILFFYRTIVLEWPLAIKVLYLFCWVAFPGSLGFLSWLDYRRIIVAEPQTIQTKPEQWAVLATSEYQPFLGLSTPRAVSITWKGWLQICIGVICLVFIVFFVVSPFSGDVARDVLQRVRAAALPIGFLLLIGGWTNLNLIRQRWSHVQLFKSGNVAIGRVIRQKFQMYGSEGT
jgi:uncharacterized protein (DUF983 family)